MARLPGVSSEWVDGQLSQPPSDPIGVSSVLVIGTAADGPLYDPVRVRSVADAKAVFGAFGGGTLIRGIEEVYLTAGRGTPIDVRGMRLGGGRKASLQLKEPAANAGLLATNQETGYALLVEALLPGSVYNRVTIGSRDGRTIEMLNPKTSLISVVNYDSNRDNVQADVHDVRELVDLINSDPNLNSIVRAEYRSLVAHFELPARYGDGLETDSRGEWHAAVSGVYLDSSGRTSITLADRTVIWTNVEAGIDSSNEASGILTTRLLDNFPASGGQTSGNNISELRRVYAIADVGDPERLATYGVSEALLNFPALNTQSRANKETLTALEDYNLDGKFWFGPDEISSISEFRQVYDRLFIGTGDGATVAFSWDAPVCMDDGDTTDVTVSLVRTAISTGNNIAQTTDTGYSTTTANTLTGFIIDKDGRDDDWLGQTPSVSGTFAAYWNESRVGQPVADYSLTWDGATATVTTYGSPRATLTFTTAPPNGTRIYVSYKSVRRVIPENSSLASVQSESGAWDAWRRYFVSGNKITFGATMPSDIEVRYQKVVDYEVGTQVELISDPPSRVPAGPRSDTYSTVRFNDPSNQPGPGISGLMNTQDTILGFAYEYLPEMPAFTTFKNLSGGTNGDKLNTNQLYSELDTAYTHIENYPVDIIVPMQASIDAVKDGESSDTGLTQKVNAGFHTQLGDFLETLTENVDETIGIIGVEPTKATDPGSVNTWVDKLTIIRPGDLTRPANVMSTFDNRLVQVVAFEPVYGNDLENLTYSSSGATAYAGLVASLPHHISPLNKTLNNVINLRYRLSKRQLERMIDSRFVVANASRTGADRFVVTDDPTAAARGSDFSALATVRIVVLAMNVVRAVAEPFVGQPNTNAQLLAMKQAITSGLRALVDPQVGALNGFDFEIVSTPAMRARHLVNIELVLVPAFTMKQIRTVVRLKANI